MEAFAQNEYADYILLDFAREDKAVRQNYEEIDFIKRNIVTLYEDDLRKLISVFL